MNRRDFLKDSSLFALASAHSLPGIILAETAAGQPAEDFAPNTNWVDSRLGAKVSVSSYVTDPPHGYMPISVFGDNPYIGWQATEGIGAWIQIDFGQLREVSELWLQLEPLPTDIVGQNVYMSTHSRVPLFLSPQRIRISFSNGASYTAELKQVSYFQILALPKSQQTLYVRITVEEVWPKPGGREAGIAKIRIFPKKHLPTFEVITHLMYDVRGGRAVQAATLDLVNPGEDIQTSEIRISLAGTLLMTVPMDPIPACATIHQSIWIPAPFEDSEMEFEVTSKSATFCCKRTLQVPRYHSYFDGGTFALHCTNHNDLGWLDTPEKTADYRSAALILPAIDLMRQYPEFQYSMECTAYLMEFLNRHPEKRDEMAEFMRQKRFSWGASYVELLQVSAGPEKLVRQFYFGRGWLKKTFPGVDSHIYYQTDPPQMSLQMPQLLAKAGVRYCLLGRLAYGFYNWRSPDGSSVLTYGYRYERNLINPKDNTGWLRFLEEYESYYKSHHFPRTFIYDYSKDYLPPQPALVPYVDNQNESMEAFASVWNAHFAGDKTRSIEPPRMVFTTAEEFLDQFTTHPLNITSLYGDWPLNWAYYDEPSNREALLNGRQAHNALLSAERLYAGLSLTGGFGDYPAGDFMEAWRTNIWPDHGWGGNLGTKTDQVYADSYAKSKTLAEGVLASGAQKLANNLPKTSDSQISIAVYNPLSWKRTDIVELNFRIPDQWLGCTLVDEKGKDIPCEFLVDSEKPGEIKAIFVAREAPAVGYCSYYLNPSGIKPANPSPLDSQSIENDFFRLTFGLGGIKSLYDKRQQWEVLRTEKFDGGEVLQFTAPGDAWGGIQSIGMQDFDRTTNHDFKFVSVSESAIRITAIREAEFNNFTLREYFHLYKDLDRLDIEVEILNWDGSKARELRIAFPINLDKASLSYEVPFGVVEIGKDELDFSLLPQNLDSSFSGENDAHPLSFREAINWIDASSPNYMSFGCLAASDATLHVFEDETTDPVSYPILQHVLLSVRRSQAWNPEYWFTQKGNHRYRMALLPHSGNWRSRYREAIGFNYRLIAFVIQGKADTQGNPVPSAKSFLQLEPPNLILTAMKKSEDDDRIALRFYEGEGNQSTARIRLSVPIRQAWRTSLIEEDQELIRPLEDGSVEFNVGPWEIITLKVSI
jgi:alpha-mannosidase